MCYDIRYLQGRRWAEPAPWGGQQEPLPCVFLFSAPGGWTSGKGCWLPLMVKKPSLANLRPGRLQTAKGS